MGSPVQKIRTRVEDLNKDETKKAMYFSTLARKQLMLLEVFNETVTSAKSFWEKTAGERGESYNDAIFHLESIHSKFGTFIEFLKENQETVLPDAQKLAGYMTLFYGDFI